MAALRFYDLNADAPTNLGMLLFGKHPEMFIPSAYLQYVKFDGPDNSCDILAENAYKGPFLRMVEELNAFVKVGIASPHSERISALQEETRYRYPDWSIRELLLNSIIHRDYEIGNAPIKFYDYGGRIEISNPGGLYGQATPENFPYVSDYRNPLLAEAMKVMGYVNKFNRGITKVKAEMVANGNPVPIFDVNKRTEFRVTLRPADSVVDDRNDKRNELELPTDKRNDKRNDKRKIVEIISQNPGIQRKELSQKSGIPLPTLDRMLKELKSGNGDFPQIEHRGSDKTGGWFIKS